jgi:hypothetical protein
LIVAVAAANSDMVEVYMHNSRAFSGCVPIKPKHIMVISPGEEATILNDSPVNCVVSYAIVRLK